MRPDVRSPFYVAAVAVVVFFTLLGGSRLWDEDEPKNAACAREMLEAGNWLVPQFNYQLRTDKPILLYWFMSAAYGMFGVTEFAARFWSATFAVGTTLLTFGLGRRLYGPRVGLWSGLALSGCLMFAVSGRAATPDSLLIFCTTSAFYLFARFGGVDGAELRRGGYAATFAAMGMAVLAKGPVGVVLPIAVLGLFRLTDPRRGGIGGLARSPRRWFEAARSLRPATLLVVVGAIGLPWYVAVGWKTGGEWLVGFLGRHNLERFTGTLENHSGSILYYPVAILIGFFPWSCFVPWGLYRLVRRLRSAAAPPVADAPQVAAGADRYVACWIGVYVVFFSLAGTKLPSYVLPCYPALALLVGRLLDEWLHEPRTVPRAILRLGLATPIVVGLGLMVGLPIVTERWLPGEERLAWLGLPLVLGGIVVLGLFERGRCRAVPPAFAAMAGVFVVALVGPAASCVSSRSTSAALVAAARLRAGPDVPLVAYRHYEPTLVFYAQGEVPTVGTIDRLRAELRRRPGAWIVTRDEFLPELEAAFTSLATSARMRRFLRREGEVILADPAPQVAAAPEVPELLRR